jgi:TctA family transporter
MLISRGSPMIFLEHPIAAALLAIAALALISILVPSVRSLREVAFKE